MTSTEFLSKINRFQLTLGGLAIFFGAVGLYLARNIDFTAPVGAETGFPDYEIRLMPFNRLGALLILGIGVIGVVAGLIRKPSIGYAAAGAAVVLALQVVVQWRSGHANVLGTAGQNLSFDLLLAIGFGLTAVLARYAPALGSDASSGAAKSS
jgi:hypothetical protein